MLTDRCQYTCIRNLIKSSGFELMGMSMFRHGCPWKVVELDQNISVRGEDVGDRDFEDDHSYHAHGGEESNGLRSSPMSWGVGWSSEWLLLIWLWCHACYYLVLVYRSINLRNKLMLVDNCCGAITLMPVVIYVTGHWPDLLQGSDKQTLFLCQTIGHTWVLVTPTFGKIGMVKQSSISK